MSLRTARVHVVVSVVCNIAVAGALSAQSDLETPARTLWTVDSLRIGHASLSLDGRWAALAVQEGSSRSVWMAPMKGGAPIRLTDAGFQDRIPMISPTGDRVFFLSNRPSRQPNGTAFHIMSIGVDAGTGRAVGTPRQVSTDTISNTPIAISRDGKWIAYVTNGPNADVRVLSVNGGMPRTLASRSADGISGWNATFTTDGRFVVYRDSANRVLRRVPFAGGAAVTLARESRGILAPLPYSDSEYVYGDPRGDSPFLTERKDMRGRTVATVQVTPQYGNGIFRYDGAGMLGARGIRMQGLDRVDLTSGQRTPLLSTTTGSFGGRAADGSLLWAQNDSGRRVLTRVSADGRSTRIALPPETRKIAGLTADGSGIVVYGAESPTAAPVRNKIGSRGMQRTRPAYLVDIATGRSRKLTDAALPGCCARNWGENERMTALTVAKGGNVEVHALDNTGTLRLLRTFSAAAYGNLLDVTVRGDRVAWADQTSPQTQTIFTARGSAAPQSVATVASEADIALTWSPDGTRLAAAYADVPNNRRAVVRIFRDAGNGSLQPQGEALDLGETQTDYFETLMWVPGREAVLVVHDFGPQHLNQLVLRPLDATKPPMKLASGEQFAGFHLEPDGTSILALNSRVTGSAVWTVLIEPKR